MELAPTNDGMGGARPASNPTDRSAVGGADAFVGRVTVVAFARVFGEGAAPDAGVEGEAAVEDKGLLREESNLCMWVVSICFTALAVGARSDGWPEVVAPAEDDSAFFDVLFAEVTAGAATGAVTVGMVLVVVVGVLLCVDEVAAAAAAVVMGCSLGLATVALPGVAGRGGASGGVKGGSFCFFTAPDIAENKPCQQQKQQQKKKSLTHVTRWLYVVMNAMTVINNMIDAVCK